MRNFHRLAQAPQAFIQVIGPLSRPEGTLPPFFRSLDFFPVQPSMRLRISSRLTESLLSRTNHPLPLFAVPNRFSRRLLPQQPET